METIGEARARENKTRLIELTWPTWLTTPFERPMTFTDYIDAIGLGDKPEVVTKEDAIEKAQDILSRLKGAEATHGTI